MLDTQTKLIHHAIRIAAYNTMQTLARAIITNTGYARAHDEAHTLIRTALTSSGDIIPDPATATLHIRLDPLPAPRHTAAINELCQAPQRHQHHLPRHEPDPALQHQIPLVTLQKFLRHVRSPGPSSARTRSPSSRLVGSTTRAITRSWNTSSPTASKPRLQYTVASAS